MGADRAFIRAHANAAQWEVDEQDEYDDEYDDSFDDLGGAGADGVADVEGKPDLLYLSTCSHKDASPTVLLCNKSNA